MMCTTLSHLPFGTGRHSQAAVFRSYCPEFLNHILSTQPLYLTRNITQEIIRLWGFNLDFIRNSNLFIYTSVISSDICLPGMSSNSRIPRYLYSVSSESAMVSPGVNSIPILTTPPIYHFIISTVHFNIPDSMSASLQQMFAVCITEAISHPNPHTLLVKSEW